MYDKGIVDSDNIPTLNESLDTNDSYNKEFDIMLSEGEETSEFLLIA